MNELVWTILVALGIVSLAGIVTAAMEMMLGSTGPNRRWGRR